MIHSFAYYKFIIFITTPEKSVNNAEKSAQ